MRARTTGLPKKIYFVNDGFAFIGPYYRKPSAIVNRCESYKLVEYNLVGNNYVLSSDLTLLELKKINNMVLI